MTVSSRFTTRSITKFFLVSGFIILMNSCAGTDALTSETIDDTATTTDVGTTLGNPVRPKTAITFQSLGSSGSSLTRALTASQDYCTAYTEDGASSQLCTFTPQSYGIGVLAAYLLECFDAAGVAVPCGSVDLASITRHKVYDGDQVDIELSSSAAAFDSELSEVDAGINVGGIQFVTPYIDEQMPDADSSATETAKIAENAYSMNVRICLTPNSVDAETMATRCAANALMGDYLVDQDQDGTLGFIDFWSDPQDSHDSVDRPEEYTELIGDNPFNTGTARFLPVEMSPNPEITTTDFYAVAGYFAPIFPLTSVVPYEEGEEYSFNVIFDIRNTLAFIDGNGSKIWGDPVCVAELQDEGEECIADDDGSFDSVYNPADGDSDPGSVGIFNPYYDGIFFPQLPAVTLTVE